MSYSSSSTVLRAVWLQLQTTMYRRAALQPGSCQRGPGVVRAKQQRVSERQQAALNRAASSLVVPYTW
jgi:hypothetical protein